MNSVYATLRILFALCLPAFVLVFSSPATAQNLLTNPGFESGDLTGWTTTSFGTPPAIVADNGPSAGGTSAASWDVPLFSDPSVAFEQVVPASAGTVYYWSFDQKSDGSPFPWVVQLNSQQIYLGSVAPSWVTLAGSFTAPPGTTSIEFTVTSFPGFPIQLPTFLTLDNFYLGTEQPVSVEGSTWGQIKSLYK